MKRKDMKIGEAYAVQGKYEQNRESAAAKKMTLVAMEARKRVYSGSAFTGHVSTAFVLMRGENPLTGNPQEQAVSPQHVLMPWAQWEPIAEQRRARDEERLRNSRDMKTAVQALDDQLERAFNADPQRPKVCATAQGWAVVVSTYAAARELHDIVERGMR